MDVIQKRTAHSRPAEVCPNDARITGRPLDLCVPEVSGGEVCSPQIGAAQPGGAEIGAAQVRPLEVASRSIPRSGASGREAPLRSAPLFRYRATQYGRK